MFLRPVSRYGFSLSNPLLTIAKRCKNDSSYVQIALNGLQGENGKPASKNLEEGTCSKKELVVRKKQMIITQIEIKWTWKSFWEKLTPEDVQSLRKDIGNIDSFGTDFPEKH